MDGKGCRGVSPSGGLSWKPAVRHIHGRINWGEVIPMKRVHAWLIALLSLLLLLTVVWGLVWLYEAQG